MIKMKNCVPIMCHRCSNPDVDQFEDDTHSVNIEFCVCNICNREFITKAQILRNDQRIKENLRDNNEQNVIEKISPDLIDGFEFRHGVDYEGGYYFKTEGNITYYICNKNRDYPFDYADQSEHTYHILVAYIIGDLEFGADNPFDGSKYKYDGESGDSYQNCIGIYDEAIGLGCLITYDTLIDTEIEIECENDIRPIEFTKFINEYMSLVDDINSHRVLPKLKKIRDALINHKNS